MIPVFCRQHRGNGICDGCGNPCFLCLCCALFNLLDCGPFHNLVVFHYMCSQRLQVPLDCVVGFSSAHAPFWILMASHYWSILSFGICFQVWTNISFVIVFIVNLSLCFIVCCSFHFFFLIFDASKLFHHRPLSAPEDPIADPGRRQGKGAPGNVIGKPVEFLCLKVMNAWKRREYKMEKTLLEALDSM